VRRLSLVLLLAIPFLRLGRAQIVPGAPGILIVSSSPSGKTCSTGAQTQNYIGTLYTCQSGTYQAIGGGGGGGTVTSVGLSLPATIFAVSGSPVTGSGTLTGAYATGQTANQVFGTNGSGAVGLYAPSSISGLGNVVGPASAVSGDLPSFSDTTGKLIGDSNIAAANVDTLSGNQTITGTKAFPTATTLGGVAFNSLTGVGKWIAGVPSTSASSDIVGLWSGTCNSSTFLAGNGVCGTVTFPQTISVAGAASAPGLLFNGTPYSAGTASTNWPYLFLNFGTTPTTLNTSGELFGINSPSGWSGNLLTLWANGTKRLVLDSAGDIIGQNAAGTVSGFGGYYLTSNTAAFADAWTGLKLGSGRVIGWSSTTAYTGTTDTGVSRLSAGAVSVDTGTPGNALGSVHSSCLALPDTVTTTLTYIVVTSGLVVASTTKPTGCN
jgi:hypothetical protein